MSYYIEVRNSLRRNGKPKLIPVEEAHKFTGFRTVYAYDAPTAETIMASRSTALLKGTEVHSETLLIDFDHNDCSEFRTFLIKEGIGFEEYDTGNRGLHFHVSLVPMTGSWVPGAQKKWVKKHAPTADTSFYHAAGIYRLPRTFHSKVPGKFKQLINKSPGKALVITKPAASEPSFEIHARGDSTISDVFQLMLQSQSVGQRQPHIWRIAMTAADAGLSFHTALSHCRWWNSRFCRPMHTDNILLSQCEKVYRQTLRRSNEEPDFMAQEIC